MVTQKPSEEQKTSKLGLVLITLVFCAAIYQFHDLLCKQMEIIEKQNERLNEFKGIILDIEEKTELHKKQKSALEELLIGMPISVQDCSFFEQIKRTVMETIEGQNDSDRVLLQACNIIK